MSGYATATTVNPGAPWDGAEVEFSPIAAVEALLKEWQEHVAVRDDEASRAEDHARRQRRIATESRMIAVSLADVYNRLREQAAIAEEVATVRPNDPDAEQLTIMEQNAEFKALSEHLREERARLIAERNAFKDAR